MEDERKIANIFDMTIEFLDILKDGVVSRIVDGKNKKMKYGILELRDMFHNNDMELEDESVFVARCNKMIRNNQNYVMLGKLKIKFQKKEYYITNTY